MVLAYAALKDDYLTAAGSILTVESPTLLELALRFERVYLGLARLLLL